jgi:benzoyl-CoA 2,3-dioxygenase component B
MLHHSGFAPLARSMGPMLKEEAFHLFTGQSGLSRVLKAGKAPVDIIQKYLYKWISTGQDLLDKDRSSSANRFYRWGFKGRFDEETAKEEPKDLDLMNEEARGHYYKECRDIIDILNQQIPAGQPRLRAPDPKFNRAIGAFSGKNYTVDGHLLTETEYGEHLKSVLPQSADLERLKAITQENDWVVTTQDPAR